MSFRFLIVLLFIFSFSQKIHSQNYAMGFDGINDRVTVPNNPAYNLGTGDFTLEALVNFTPGITTPQMPIISTRTNGINGFLFLSFSSGTQLLLQTGGVGNEVSLAFPNIRDGNCHHLAVIRTGANTTAFYVDGVQVGVSTLGHLGINSPGSLYIGYDLYDDDTFNGSISEIRFWNIGRSQTEIQTYMNSPIPNNSTGLIGLWRFNEGNGESVVDSSATKNNGYMGNSTTDNVYDPIRNTACTAGDLISGIADREDNVSCSLAPNPFIDETTLTLEAISSEYYVQVFTIQGTLVAEHKTDANNPTKIGKELPKGIYFVNVIEGTSSRTLKMIKE